jgi:hypothetical protein
MAKEKWDELGGKTGRSKEASYDVSYFSNCLMYSWPRQFHPGVNFSSLPISDDDLEMDMPLISLVPKASELDLLYEYHYNEIPTPVLIRYFATAFVESWPNLESLESANGRSPIMIWK